MRDIAVDLALSRRHLEGILKKLWREREREKLMCTERMKRENGEFEKDYS